MKRLILSILAVFVVIGTVSFAYAQTSKDVNVVNTAAAPVNVRSVDDPAKRAFQLAFEVNGTNPVATPVGKVFVVEHVSGSFRLGSVSGLTTTCRFLQLAFPVSGVTGLPEALELLPTVMGTVPSIGMDLTFVSINNPMKFYIR